MHIEDEKRGDVLIARIRAKRLDAESAGSFKDAIKAFIERGDTRIVLDLAQIEFIDSSGLGALVSALKLAGADRLALCNLVHANCRSLFQLTRMDRIFEIGASEDEAVAAVQRAA